MPFNLLPCKLHACLHLSTAWHTPGHTPGSVVLLCGEHLFCGVTLTQHFTALDQYIGRIDHDVVDP